MASPHLEHIPASYKDPAGFVYKKDGVIYRQINTIAQKDFDLLLESGLYKDLVSRNHLIRHEAVPLSKKATDDAYAVVKPEQITFISYPYEWSFSQLKDAALLTLEVQKIALEYGMSLKDASAYNVQFRNNKPILIDTLSFETYNQGKPWVAYRQFCQHFLAPLALAAYIDLRFLPLQRQYLDGYPLDFVSRLLPRRTLLNLGLSMHIHAHAKSQSHFADKKTSTTKSVSISLTALRGILENLTNTVGNLKLPRSSSEWGDYYDVTNYTETSFHNKKKLIEQFVKKTMPSTVLDLGANTGEFSRAAAQYATFVISTDYDLPTVEKNYALAKKNQEDNILPLVLDVTNPSSAQGWAGAEREGFFSRGSFDMILALALIHHLVITFNLPLKSVSEFLAQQTTYLIIEFVPKEDSQVQKLLQNREDIFPDYHTEGFEKAFMKNFKIIKKEPVLQSKRTLYLFKSL